MTRRPLLACALVLGLGACFPFPVNLADTGLYADGAGGPLAEGVLEYRPRFELWSDTAQKRRFVLLPEGETIDTGDMDFWRFPTGTKLFKEFSRDGVRAETRMLHKLDSGEWTMVAYLWNGDQTAATAVPEGTENAHRTAHDVPALEDCVRCHEGAPDRVLGFTALQLAHENDGVTLQQLVDESLLSDPPANTTLTLPGDSTEAAVFGYLHANCGSCHNSTTDLDTPLRLFVKVSELGGAASDTDIYNTTVDVDVYEVPEGAPDVAKVIAPGSPSSSMLFVRTQERGEDFWQMPPLASESVDGTATALLEQWILSL